MMTVAESTESIPSTAYMLEPSKRVNPITLHGLIARTRIYGQEFSLDSKIGGPRYQSGCVRSKFWGSLNLHGGPNLDSVA